MICGRMRVSQQLAAGFVLAVIAFAASGCGDGTVEPVALLQMSQPTLVTKKQRARPTPPAPVRASLAATATAPAAPPVVVPQVGSVAVGAPNSGRLVNGVQLPASGPDWIALSAPEGRWTTDRMLSYLLAVLRDYRLANPGAPQVMIGDLSLPHGGPMGGHVSHQNGLDVDVFYPRLDRSLQVPRRVADVDRALSQDLVSRFVAAGAQFTFVGLRVGLGGPPGIVQAIRNHNDHMHVRIANLRR
jgi:murein endopeptidase